MEIQDWIQSTTRLQREKSPLCNPFTFINDVSAIIKLNHLYLDASFPFCDNMSELRSAAREMSISEISSIVWNECVKMGIIH